MVSNRSLVSSSAIAALLVGVLATSASAHGIAGNRVFPATLAIDDPAVADELSFPTFSFLEAADGSSETDFSFEYAKTITERFGVSFGETWTQMKPGGISGFQNLETTFKYLAAVDPAHEFMFSTGLSIEWGGTGAASVADPFTTITPQIYFGKGFGDIGPSNNLLRPLALTGQFGLAIPTEASASRSLNWGFTLQYSLPYMSAHVRALPDFLARLTPLVEVALSTPLSNSDGVTTGTVSPGIIYSAPTYQLGVEALIPINAESGGHVGVIAQVHFFLDDIFPKSLGKPLFP